MPVELHRQHPDTHAPWRDYAEDEILHVAAIYINPFRRRTIRELANDFRRHMAQQPNVRLHMGEIAFAGRPFEVTCADNPDDVQFRVANELFYKENAQAQIIKRFPPGWKKGAVIDADFHFTRHDWALEAVHQLDHWDWVQLFSSYADITGDVLLGEGHRPTRLNNSFAYNYVLNDRQLPDGYSNGGWRKSGIDVGDYYGCMLGPGGKGRGVGATGGAWSFTRHGYDTCGGLLEECILGHGDWFMSFGLIGEEAPDMHSGAYTEDYRQHIAKWQRNAARLQKNIGYVDSFAVHGFHGSKTRRAYSSRDLILARNKFAPSLDLKRDWQGLWQLNPDKPRLRDEMRQYFLMRQEDDPTAEQSIL